MGGASPEETASRATASAIERETARRSGIGAQRDLADWLGARIATWDRAAPVDALGRADVPAGPVNGVGEALAAMGRGWTTRIDGIDLAPNPILVDGLRLPVRLAPPLLEQHAAAVLREIGIDTP